MKTKTFLTFLSALFLVQHVFAQTNYTGTANLNKKGKSFSLVNTSTSDTYNVQIEGKTLRFNNQTDFLIQKRNRKEFNLLCKGDTILIKSFRQNIDYSTGSSYLVSKKNNKALILLDKNDQVILNATSKQKKGIVDLNISILDENNKIGLLSYATYYLYYQNKKVKDANDTPYIYFSYSN